MSKTLQEWLGFIGDTPTPVMASTAKQIKHLLNLSTTNYSELVSVIQCDPGLSIQALRAINLNLDKNRDPIANIGQAVPLLGMAWLEMSIDQLPQLEKDFSAEVKSGLQACFSRAVYAMHYANYWARLRNDENPDELVTAALLDHAAEIMLWLCEPEIAQKIERIPGYGIERGRAARRILHRCAIEDLGISLITNWNLPRMRPSVRQRGVAIAFGVSKESMAGWYSPEMDAILNEAVKHVNKEAGVIISGLHGEAAAAARIHHGMGLPCPVPQMLFLPILEEPEDESESVSDTNSSAALAGSTPSNTPAKGGLQELILRAMQDMHETVGLGRTAFVMLNREKNILQTLLVKETTVTEIKQLKVEASASNIFGLLLQKPCALWMHTENLTKYAQLVPAHVNDLLDSKDFFIMSLFSNQQPIGIMFADRRADDTELTTTDFDGFKRLCQRISNKLMQH